jgi:hypothetical protein
MNLGKIGERWTKVSFFSLHENSGLTKIARYVSSTSFSNWCPFNTGISSLKGHAVAQLVLELYCVGSISCGVFQIFDSPKPSGISVALESARPITEMSTRDFPGGGGGVKAAGR